MLWHAQAIKAALPKNAPAHFVQSIIEAQIQLLRVEVARAHLLNFGEYDRMGYVTKNHNQLEKTTKLLRQCVPSWRTRAIVRDAFVFEHVSARLAALDRYEDRALGRRGRILRTLQELASERRSEI